MNLCISSPRAYTPAEYLALEEQADDKHEYYNDEVIAMAGTSWQLCGKPDFIEGRDDTLINPPQELEKALFQA